MLTSQKVESNLNNKSNLYAQGSVYSPKPINVSDLHGTMLRRIQFSDNLAQAQQSKHLKKYENSLKMDIQKLDSIKKTGDFKSI